MRVRRIMTPSVYTVTADEPVITAARLMRDKDVGAVPVCSRDGRLVGMVTDRDIVVRVIGNDRDPRIARVAECMTSPVFRCYEDEEVDTLAELMEEKQIRRVAVLNRQDRLVGIVSLGDLAIKTHNRELSGEALETVSQAA